MDAHMNAAPVWDATVDILAWSMVLMSLLQVSLERRVSRTLGWHHTGSMETSWVCCQLDEILSALETLQQLHGLKNVTRTFSSIGVDSKWMTLQFWMSDTFNSPLINWCRNKLSQRDTQSLQTVIKTSCPLKARSSARKTSEQFGAVTLLCVAASLLRWPNDVTLWEPWWEYTYSNRKALHTPDPHSHLGAATGQPGLVLFSLLAGAGLSFRS